MTRTKYCIKLVVALMFASVGFKAECLSQDMREHVWTDHSGNYRLPAEYITRNEKSIALRLEDENLLIVELAQLSDVDQAFVEEIEKRRETIDKSSDYVRPDYMKWELNNGQAIHGLVAEHGRRLIQIRKSGNSVYVNDRRYQNLPEFYQQMVFAMVNHFEQLESPDKHITDYKQLKKWIGSQAGNSASYTVEGVLLEVDNGDRYGVPFFMFKEDDLKILKPGWDEWVSAETDARYQTELSLRLRAHAMARQRDRALARQMHRLHVQLEAYDAGLFDLWKVMMYPPNNQRGLPIRVIVPARNSAQASQAALERFPNMRVGAIAKVRRKY